MQRAVFGTIAFCSGLLLLGKFGKAQFSSCASSADPILLPRNLGYSHDGFDSTFQNIYRPNQLVVHTHNNYLVTAGDVILYGEPNSGYKVASQEFECVTCTHELQIDAA